MKDATSNRDSTIDNLLREALDARLASAVPGSACLDADTLAAWADKGLGRRERAVAESHAANCPRCQALVAAMIRTTPPAAAATPWWRRRVVRWLAPLTAAAAAVVVWAIVPGGPAVQPNHQARSPVSETARPPAPPERTLPKPKSEALPRRDEAKETSALDKLRTSPADAEALSKAVAGRPDATGRLAPAEVGQSPQVAAEAPAAKVAQSFARALREEVGTDIVSPDPSSRWRIVPDGLVQRSLDGGSSWETQQTGVATTLVAGASPLPSVCWLIGHGGLVLLTEDGRSWRRVAFPEPTDLVSIRASGNKIATVVAADGRTFSTTDAGLTWTRSPGN